MYKCGRPYIAPISLELQFIGKSEEVQIGLRQDLEVAGPAGEIGDKLDRVGAGASELEEGRQCCLEPGSRRFIAN